ncbi:hypothetical protein KC336_g23018, partial [Hortaea werneckii]
QYWNTTDTSVTSTNRSSNTGKGKDKEPSFLDEISPENISAGIIPFLERNTTAQSLLKGRAYFLQRLVKQLLSAEGFEGFESSVSIAHLENRVAAAMTLGAHDEFRVYLIMYAKRIGAENLRGKVEELLKGLSGSMFEEDDEQEDETDEAVDDAVVAWGEGDEIVGWKREDLLKEVVMVLGKQRDLQRVTVPYARFLGVLDSLKAGVSEGEAMITES